MADRKTFISDTNKLTRYVPQNRMWLIFLLLGTSSLLVQAFSSDQGPLEKRDHLICYQCTQIVDPAECGFVTSKCHQCGIVASGNGWNLGCADQHCQGPECCSENLCNGNIVCPSGQYPNTGQCVSCGNCLSGVACDSSDGSCPGGCEAGWHGNNCDLSNPPVSTPAPSTDCPAGRYGPNCVNFCSGHCYLGSACDSVTGDCPELNNIRCNSGFKGTKCDTPCDEGLYGSQCLNGCSLNCYNDSSCYPDSGYCPVTSVGAHRCSSGYEGLYCNLDCERGRWGEDCIHVCSSHCWDESPCDALTGFCESFEDKPTCASGWTGDFCDKQCPRGLTGEDCLNVCTKNCYRGTACDPVTSFCPVTAGSPQCEPGWRGETCEISCPHDRYGEDCAGVCSSHCFEGGLCDGITGFCPLVEGQPRCDDGWTGARCDQVCSGGESESCVQTCTDHCYSPNACDPDNGVCSVIGASPRCQAGWFGDRCDRPCPPGTHGVDCQQLCSGFCYHGAACDRVNATCPEIPGRARCEAGWQGAGCDIACSSHTYGSDCNNLCGGECYNDTACDIISGACPKIPGRPRCRAGFQNPYCDLRCDLGRYGEDCLHVCSGNCNLGLACDSVTGECPLHINLSRCETGFFGASCQWSCNPGTYGADCQQLCTGHCYQGVSCEPVTGKCPLNNGLRKCQAGYTGDRCDTVCSAGSYGENCLQQCGNCINNENCNPVSGVCPSGCQPSYTPPLCK